MFASGLMTSSAFQKSGLATSIGENTPGLGSDQAESSPALGLTGLAASEAGPVNESVLQSILEQGLGGCRFITSAAIAFGGEDGMRCRARIGPNAPTVGTPVYPGWGLTGLCVQTGQLQLCNDVDNDSRVDVEVCKTLGIGSLLVFPLKKSGTVVGVLELVSGNANAFDERAVAQVRGLVEGETESGSLRREGPIDIAATSSMDLQKVLAAAFLIQEEQQKGLHREEEHQEEEREEEQRKDEQHQEVQRARNFAAADESQANALPNGVAPCNEPTSEVLRNFGENCFTGLPWTRAVLTVLLVLLAVFVYGYWRLAGTTTKAGTAAPMAKTANLPNPPGDSLPQQPPPKPEQSPAVVSQKSIPSTEFAALLPDSRHAPKQIDAAEANSDYELGMQYADGRGVPVNYTEAMAWFAKAAAAGDVRAQWELGQGYLEGIGVPQDDRKAAEWLKRAANQGHVEAQNELSELYLNGWGVPKDYMRAYTWTSIAAGPQAIDNDRLREIASLMSEGELQAAQQRISNWWTRSGRGARDWESQ